MQLINKNRIENAVEKFYEFPFVSKFQSARNLLEIDKKISVQQRDPMTYEEYIDKNTSKYNTTIKLWIKSGSSKRNIMHWSDCFMRMRAEKTNELKKFRDIYFYGNMYIHSGYIDYPLEEEQAHMLCAYVYSLSSDIFNKATELVCQSTDLVNHTEIIEELSRIYCLYGYFHLWKSLQ